MFEKTINGPSYEFVCDLNAATHECRTCLHLAVEHGHAEVVHLLLKVCSSLFFVAIRRIQFRIQLYALDSNDQLIPAEVGTPFLLDTYATNGRTALMTAVCKVQTEIVE